MIHRLPALLAVGVLALAGCASNAPGDLNTAAERVLAPDVQHIREVASIGSYSQLHEAVRQLLADLAAQQRAGNVSASRATNIQDAADVLLQDARGRMVTPPPSPTPTTTSTSPEPVPTSESPTPTPTTTSPSPSPSQHDSGSPGPAVSASIGTGG